MQILQKKTVLNFAHLILLVWLKPVHWDLQSTLWQLLPLGCLIGQLQNLLLHVISSDCLVGGIYVQKKLRWWKSNLLRRVSRRRKEWNTDFLCGNKRLMTLQYILCDITCVRYCLEVCALNNPLTHDLTSKFLLRIFSRLSNWAGIMGDIVQFFMALLIIFLSLFTTLKRKVYHIFAIFQIVCYVLIICSKIL